MSIAVIDPVTPNGVEHRTVLETITPEIAVIDPVTPNGVEHFVPHVAQYSSML